MTQTDDLSPLSIASTRTTPQLKLNGFRSIVVAGALFMLSFPPFGWWPLLFISIALLFHSIQSADRFRSAYGRGFLFGDRKSVV